MADRGKDMQIDYIELSVSDIARARAFSNSSPDRRHEKTRCMSAPRFARPDRCEANRSVAVEVVVQTCAHDPEVGVVLMEAEGVELVVASIAEIVIETFQADADILA